MCNTRRCERLLLWINQSRIMYVGKLGRNGYNPQKDKRETLQKVGNMFFDYLHIFEISVIRNEHFTSTVLTSDGNINVALYNITS